MQNNGFLKAVLALGLLGASACGGGGGSTGNVPIDQVDDKVVHAACVKIFQCCDEQERAVFQIVLGGPITDVASCETKFGAVIGTEFVTLQASVEAGRIAYDGNKVGECIDQLEGATCTGGFNAFEGANCDAAFVGQVAVGGACGDSGECAGGYCKGATEGHIDGMCVATPAVGQACPDFTCADGDYCKDGTCAALEVNGTACENDGDCASDNCDQSLDVAVCAAPPVSCDGA